MKNKKLIFILIIFITIIMIIFRNQEKAEKNLVNPGVSTTEQIITPSPSPKTFKYDSSTDLGKELESIDPKVLDSDFNE